MNKVRYNVTPEEITEQKQMAFYASSVDAWYNTSLERDKSLLTLSAGGIGLLTTLLTVGVLSTEILFLYAGAISGFAIALISILRIFHHNRTHIEEIILNTAENNSLLAKLDKIAFWAFIIGIIFTAIIGIVTAIYSISSEDKIMPNRVSKPTIANDSFNGAAKVNPLATEQKSYNGASALQPQPVTNTQTSTASTPSSTSSSSGGANTQNQGSNGK